MKRRWLRILFVAFLCASAPAQAAGPQSDAKRLFKEGTALYQGEKYAEAARKFEAAYAAYPSALLLINVAQAYRKAEDLEKAARYYELFLEANPNSDQAKEVEQILADIRERLEVEAAPVPEPSPPPAPPPPVRKAVVEPRPVTADGAESRASGASDRPLLTRWWLWAAVGSVLLVGGSVYAYRTRND